MSEPAPVSDRTDESLVRTIAEWMELRNVEVIDETDWHTIGLRAWGKEGWPEIFGPHMDSVGGSADRERVMLASGTYWQHIEKDGHHAWSWYDMADDIEAQTAGQGWGKESGRAFCEAVVMWIEAQGDTP